MTFYAKDYVREFVHLVLTVSGLCHSVLVGLGYNEIPATDLLARAIHNTQSVNKWMNRWTPHLALIAWWLCKHNRIDQYHLQHPPLVHYSGQQVPWISKCNHTHESYKSHIPLFSSVFVLFVFIHSPGFYLPSCPLHHTSPWTFRCARLLRIFNNTYTWAPLEFSGDGLNHILIQITSRLHFKREELSYRTVQDGWASWSWCIPENGSSYLSILLVPSQCRSPLLASRIHEVSLHEWELCHPLTLVQHLGLWHYRNGVHIALANTHPYILPKRDQADCWDASFALKDHLQSLCYQEVR